MGEPDLTAAQLERTVSSLRGLRIKKVTYGVLAGGADGNVHARRPFTTRAWPGSSPLNGAT